MKWINHKAITFATVYYLTGNVFYSLISAIGAVFPDWIEGFDYSNPNWKKRHRTYSHWWVLYISILLIVTLGFMLKFQLSLSSVKEVITSKVVILDNITYLFYGAFFWFIVGCFFHIIQDAFTGSIPVFSPNKKVRWFRISRTGTIWEYVMSVILIIFVFVIAR
ncbi:MAG: metal-dependent hydrolase [Thermofilaceae archaeon]